MSFLRASFRAAAPLRKAPLGVQVPRVQVRAAFRKYSTEAPQSKSNTTLYASLGAAVAVGGFALYYYTDAGKEAGSAVKSGIQSVKVKANFVPTKQDYIKVCTIICRRISRFIINIGI